MKNNHETKPLVSCLCVTKNSESKLKRAIECFLAQTYPNKELIIVSEDNNQNIEFLQHYNQTNIIHISIPIYPKKTLGELRNLAISSSRGEYFCQWDDDDWYHQDRIKIQAENAFKYHHPATILTNWIFFDELTEQAYFSFSRMWEGSIFCKKEIFQEEVKYPHLSKLEDTPFVNNLLRESKIYPVVSPFLYIYIFHGNNTWDQQHFLDNYDYCQTLSSNVSNLISEILKGKYSVQEGSILLESELVLKDINFFHLEKAKAHKEIALEVK